MSVKPGAADPTEGLVAHWTFDSTLVDETGVNNGTAFGDPEYGDGWAYVPVNTSLLGCEGSLVNSTTGLMTLYGNAPANIANHTINFYAVTNGVQNAYRL